MGDETLSGPVAGPTLAQAVERIAETLQNPPERIERQIVLTGESAARYAVAHAVVMSSTGWDASAVDAYLLRGGAVRELERLGQAVEVARKGEGHGD